MYFVKYVYSEVQNELSARDQIRPIPEVLGPHFRLYTVPNINGIWAHKPILSWMEPIQRYRVCLASDSINKPFHPLHLAQDLIF